MRYRILKYLMVAMAVGALGCSQPRQFRVDGEVAGNPNMNVYLRYYGDGSVRTAVTAATSGKFAIAAESQEPTVVAILDNEMRVLGRLYLVNGDKVSVKLQRHDPYRLEVSGSPINEEWAQVLADNAEVLGSGSPAEVNDLVESYIAEHRDNPVASLMYATLYDASLSPVRADSVMQSIEPEGRLASVLESFVTTLAPFAGEESTATVDSLVYRTFESREPKVLRPGDSKYTVLVLYNEQSRHKDSIVPNLKVLSASKMKKDMQVVDLSLMMDTSAWKNLVRRDTATWERAWIPGGLFARGIDKLAVPRLPYYVVLDSAGQQIYRGHYQPIDSIIK